MIQTLGKTWLRTGHRKKTMMNSSRSFSAGIFSNGLGGI